jgi:hypothetical protein
MTVWLNVGSGVKYGRPWLGCFRLTAVFNVDESLSSRNPLGDFASKKMACEHRLSSNFGRLSLHSPSRLYRLHFGIEREGKS